VSTAAFVLPPCGAVAHRPKVWLADLATEAGPLGSVDLGLAGLVHCRTTSAARELAAAFASLAMQMQARAADRGQCEDCWTELPGHTAQCGARPGAAPAATFAPEVTP